MSDDDQSGDRGEAADRPQDPLVGRLRPDPAKPPEPTRILEGLLGDSDRPGFRRLYFTAQLDYYAEFRTEDVIAVADIPPDQPPFLGEPATRVTLRRDAPVDFTRSERAGLLDEFDLDVRLQDISVDVSRELERFGRTIALCRGSQGGCTIYLGRTCLTCRTCHGTRCH